MRKVRIFLRVTTLLLLVAVFALFFETKTKQVFITTEGPDESSAPYKSGGSESGAYISSPAMIPLAGEAGIFYDTLKRRLIVDRELLAGDEVVQTDNDGERSYTFELEFIEDVSGVTPVNNLLVNTITLSGRSVRIDCTRIRAFETEIDGAYLYINMLHPKEKYDLIFVLDPGHGGEDDGGMIGTACEKDINMGIALKVFRLLEDEPGIKVYLTRYDDSSLLLMDRVNMANDLADYFISVHNNIFENGQSVSGTEIYCRDRTDSRSRQTNTVSSGRLAETVYENLLLAAGTRDRGITDTAKYYLLRYIRIPSILVEVGFMTNPDELARLLDDEYQARCAEGIYKGILEALR